MKNKQTHQSKILPSSNVVLEGNGTAGALALTNRQVLIESGGALDRRGVGANDLINVIGRAVRHDGALVGACRPGVVGAVRINDIVFDQGGSGPAVEGEKAVATGAEGARVANGSGSTSGPANTGDDVLGGGGPGQGIGTRANGHGGTAASLDVARVIVPARGAGSAGGDGQALGQFAGGSHGEIGCGRGQDSHSAGESDQDVSEGQHCGKYASDELKLN